MTTANRPPCAFGGDRGVPLPLGTTDLLAAAVPPAPAPPAFAPDPGALLGHLLTAAFGLQRREPSNVFNDHRTAASVRGKYPVRVFVTGPSAGLRYHDPYRHALIDADPGMDRGAGLGADASTDATRVLLVPHLADFPVPYRLLRAALAALETGFQLRALAYAAQALDVRAEAGHPSGNSGTLLARTGGHTGPQWGTAVPVRLPGLSAAATGPLRRVGRRRGPRPDDPTQDAALARGARPGSPADVCAPMLLRHAATPLSGQAADRTWADLLWQRHSGRAVAHVGGFATQPRVIDATAVTDMAAWSAAEPPGALRPIARRVRTSVVVQRVNGVPDGVHRVRDGCLEFSSSAGADRGAGTFAALESTFGYATSPLTDSSLRHANTVWVYSADLRALLADEGAGAWELAQWCCGWAAHGICLAAAGHRLYARTVRSYDEIAVQHLLGLPEHETPLFMVINGVPRFIEPLLDLRV
ncbi:hypothetical protein ABZ746_38235 [Streptomyces sp. NPDC020096]